MLCFEAHAQYTLKIAMEGADEDLIMERADSLSVRRTLDSLRYLNWEKGHLENYFENLNLKDSVWETTFIRGVKYSLVQIQIDSANLPLIDQSNLRIKDYLNKPIRLNSIKDLSASTLRFLENTGYPFATAQLKNSHVKNGQVSAELDIIRGPFITYDTILIEGNVNLRQSFLQRHLNFRKGEAYDRENVLKLKQKIQNLPYLQLSNDPLIKFVNEKAELQLNLKPKNASRFDFLIGIQQNQAPNGTQEYTITGEFTAEMLNKLGFGEHMFVEYKRLRPETQELELRFNYPYVFNQPFGIDSRFKLFRNTNQFIELDANLGIQYVLDGRDQLKGFWSYKSSRLLEIDTVQILNSRQLPNNLDVSYNGLGLSILVDRTDYRFNPRRGFDAALSGTIGFKNIIPNVAIQGLSNSEIDFSTSYDSLDLRTYQFELHFDGAYYIPVLNNLIIKSRNQSALKWSPGRIYRNELYRIGGNRLLRGFDEQSVLSQFYSVFSFELRFLLAEQNSNFSLSLPFIDYGITYSEEREIRWDQPFGVGVGLNFETGAGLFNFAIAAGKQLQNSLDFNNLKVHFGYESLF